MIRNSKLDGLQLRRHAKFDVVEPIHCRIIAFCCTYITLRCDLDLLPRYLDLWTLTFDREHLQRIAYDVRRLVVNPVPNLNAIEQSVEEVLRFQCLMLWRYVTLWPWFLTRLPGKFTVHHVIKVCTKFERNRAISGWIIDNFANFCTRYVTLWPWPLTSW